MMTAAALILPLLSGPTASALPVDGGAAGKSWAATASAPPQHPKVATEWDVPITMSDGTVLKANVYRPADANGRPIRAKTPVVLTLTPYTKLVSAVASAFIDAPGVEGSLNRLADAMRLGGTPVSGIGDLLSAVPGGAIRTFAVNGDLVRSGYTQVVVDVRGTGFSQGVWDTVQDREQRDSVEVIDWAARQRWSTGKVGMSGISYSGVNQLQAASHQPPALKAIFPVEPSADFVRDLVAPGGSFGVSFVTPWLLLVNGLKLIPDVRSLLNGTFDGKWLKSRVSNPAVFVDVLVAALTVPTIDDIPPSMGRFLDQDSRLRQNLMVKTQNITTPTMMYGGWHDILAYSQPRAYNSIPLPPGKKQLIMGDTYHLAPAAGLGKPGGPPRLDVLQRAWFDHWLKGVDNGIEKWGPVTAYQQGGGWQKLSTFPRAGMSYRRLYLDPTRTGTSPGAVHDGSLRPAGPARGRLTVAPGVTTLCSQDTAQGTGGIGSALDACGKDSRIAEHSALTFTTAPVSRPTQISGPINLHLATVLDRTDGYWTATLNDVAPDGRSTVLTTGQLVASLRKIDDSRSAKSPNGDYTDPFQTLNLPDRLPVVPGARTVLDIGLIPTEAVIKPGHRIRIDVFAANIAKGLPLRPLLNESGLAPQHLLTGGDDPSFVNLPTDRAVS